MKWSTLSLLLFLTAFSFVIRFYYSEMDTMYPIGADSVGYYELGIGMVRRPSLETIVTKYRTPFYPLFLVAMVHACGNAKTYTLDDLHASADCIVRAQTVIGVLSVIVFYFLLKQMKIGKTVSVLTTMLLSWDIFVFAWEQFHRTETFSIFFLILTSFYAVRTIQNLRAIDLFLVWFWGTLGWLTRPSQILVPLLAYAIIGFRFLGNKRARGRGVWRAGVLVGFTLLYLSVPAGYSLINRAYHGYAGISQVADIDMLGRILEFNLSIEAGREYPEYYEAVMAYRAHGGNPQPFRFIDWFDPLIYGDSEKMMRLRSFNRAIIGAHFGQYLRGALSNIPNTFTDIHFESKVHPKDGDLLSQLFYGIERLYTIVWMVCGYPMLLLSPVVAFFIMRIRSVGWSVIAFFVGTYVSAVLLTVITVYVADSEYSRLMAPLHPMVFAAVAYAGTYLSRRGLFRRNS